MLRNDYLFNFSGLFEKASNSLFAPPSAQIRICAAIGNTLVDDFK